MRAAIYRFVHRRFPRLWFLLAHHVENEYQSYVYRKNGLSPFGETFLKHNSLARVLAPVVEGASFLELGCDAGYFVLQAAMAGAARAVGVDRNAAALAHAERARRTLGLTNASFIQATIPDLGIESSFDNVLVFSTIHYMFSDKQGNKLQFPSMAAFVGYLSQYTGSNLFIEFVRPDDPFARDLVAARLLESGEYSEASFEAALRANFAGFSRVARTHRYTRDLYVAFRGQHPPGA